MHLNVHLALGALVAFLLVPVVPFAIPFPWVAAVILAGCVNDADFVLSRFEKNQNHRMFFTHSVYPSLALITIGLVLSFVIIPGVFHGWFLFLFGFNMLLHVLSDSIDWGVNLLYNKKLVGAKILFEGRSPEEYYSYSQGFPSPRGLYFTQYYRNKVIQVIEALSITMLLVVSILTWSLVASEHWWIFILYSFLLGFHLVEYRFTSRKNG